jgi:hypothetical protein
MAHNGAKEELAEELDAEEGRVDTEQKGPLEFWILNKAHNILQRYIVCAHLLPMPPTHPSIALLILHFQIVLSHKILSVQTAGSILGGIGRCHPPRTL